MASVQSEYISTEEKFAEYHNEMVKVYRKTCRRLYIQTEI